MNIHYLEIVTNEVDQQISLFEKMQGLDFGDPVVELGGARVAKSPDGGSVAVRAPMHSEEIPAIRPYFLTDTLAETLETASQNGAQVAMSPTKIHGHGTFAIYIVDGMFFGLWKI